MSEDAQSPMEKCSDGGHKMKAWPEGADIMAAIADSPFNTAIISEPMQCEICGSLAFILRGKERVFVPHYETTAYGKPIRLPLGES